jgi:hypothetical protein
VGDKMLREKGRPFSSVIFLEDLSFILLGFIMPLLISVEDFALRRRLVSLHPSLGGNCPAPGLRGTCNKPNRPGRQRIPSWPIRLMPHTSEQSPSAFLVGVYVFHSHQQLERLVHNESPENSTFSAKFNVLSHDQVRLFLQAVAAVDEADCSGFGTHDDGVGQSV